MDLGGFLLSLISSFFNLFVGDKKSDYVTVSCLFHLNTTPSSLLLPALVAVILQEDLHPITGYVFQSQYFMFLPGCSSFIYFFMLITDISAKPKNDLVFLEEVQSV